VEREATTTTTTAQARLAHCDLLVQQRQARQQPRLGLPRLLRGGGSGSSGSGSSGGSGG
jgi:hypothetical protein